MHKWRLPMLYVLVGALTVVFWLRGLPGVDSLPGWLYHPERNFPIGPACAALAAACAPLLIVWAWREVRAGRHARALSALTVVGISVQFTIHFLVPAGLEQNFERLLIGHGEFLRTAAARRGHLLETLRDYEALFAQGKIGSFSGSKPPGTLGFYMLVDAVANSQLMQSLLAPLLSAAQKSRFVADVAPSAALIVVLFPYLTYLALIPLFALARELTGDPEDGFAACLLFLTTPGIVLIDLHLDGALFPLISAATVALTVRAVRRGSWAAAIAAGMIVALGVYCSYSMLLVVAVAGAIGVVVAVEPGLRTSSALVGALRAPVTMFASALLTTGLLVLLLNFEPLLRFRNAVAFHTAWKSGVPTALWRKVSLLEFGLYAGLPLMVALALELGRATHDLWTRQRLVVAAWTWLVVLGLLATAAYQGTNEAARLWLFMIPWIVSAVALGLRARAREPGDMTAVLALGATQAVTLLMMKVSQPW